MLGTSIQTSAYRHSWLTYLKAAVSAVGVLANFLSVLHSAIPFLLPVSPHSLDSFLLFEAPDIASVFPSSIFFPLACLACRKKNTTRCAGTGSLPCSASFFLYKSGGRRDIVVQIIGVEIFGQKSNEKPGHMMTF